MLNERRLAFEDATARLRYVHRPGWKDPEQDPFAKDRQENADIVRKVQHVRQQWSRIKLRERRRRHRHKLARRASLAKLSSATAEATAEDAGAGTDATMTTAPVPNTQTTRHSAPTTRRAPRMVYPLLKKPMAQKAINKKLHKIKNRRILHRAIKSRLHLTLKANQWGRFPRTRRTCRFSWIHAQGSFTDGDFVLQLIITSISSPLEVHISIFESFSS